jgi:hypothetical protein
VILLAAAIAFHAVTPASAPVQEIVEQFRATAFQADCKPLHRVRAHAVRRTAGRRPIRSIERPGFEIVVDATKGAAMRNVFERDALWLLDHPKA